MSFFNAIYTLGGCRRSQPIEQSSTVVIEPASRDTCAKVNRWLTRIVSFPIQVAHAAYNTAHIILNKDINKVVAHQISEGSGIHYMPFLMGKSGHIITSPSIIAAIASKYRHDTIGPFAREADDPLISIFRDLYPEVQLDEEDLLMSCSREHVKGYRTPLLEFVGPMALPSLRPQLRQVADEVIGSLPENSLVSAKALAETYTVAIFARLFFNLTGSMEDFQGIARAFSSITEFDFLPLLK